MTHVTLTIAQKIQRTGYTGKAVNNLKIILIRNMQRGAMPGKGHHCQPSPQKYITRQWSLTLVHLLQMLSNSKKKEMLQAEGLCYKQSSL